MSAFCWVAGIDAYFYAPRTVINHAHRTLAIAMKLFSLLGFDAPLMRARKALDDGALAAEDRVQLVRMAWEADKQRFKLLFALALAVLGLAILAVAMLSAATVVHFWDTPQRVTAAWSVAGFWSLLLAASMVWLWVVLQHGSNAFGPVRGEFAQDWAWLQGRMSSPSDDERQKTREPRPETQEALLARIARQRQHFADPTPSGEVGGAAAGPVSGSAAVIELARAHPVIAGVATAGVIAVLGPRRIIRWAGWLLPLVLRSR